ncbi:unnamed protein product [Musa hybrid cultivar]
MVSNLFVLMMKALHTRWETGLHNSFLLASSVLIAILLSLFCPLFSKILGFFFPLLISTSVCSMAVHLFILSGKEAVKEVFFSNGENSAPRVIKFARGRRRADQLCREITGRKWYWCFR